MSTELRCDPLSGRVAAVVDWPGRPGLGPPRVLPAERTPCPFCLMSAGVAGPGSIVRDEDSERPVLEVSESAFAVVNRWSVFGEPSVSDGPASRPGRAASREVPVLAGVNEVIVARDHVLSLDAFSPSGLADFIGLLLARRSALASWAGREAFVNVGVQAGSSIAHVHGQVAAGDRPVVPCGVLPGACAVCRDVALARARDLVVFETSEFVAYVPWAPSVNAEVRVAALPCRHAGVSAVPPSAALAAGLGSLLRAAEASGRSWPYNVLLHPDGHAHAHLLLRFDAGVVYARAFDVVPITVSLPALADVFRSAPG